MKMSDYYRAEQILSQISYYKDREKSLSEVERIYIDNLFLQTSSGIDVDIDVPHDIAQQILEQEIQKCQTRIAELNNDLENL